MTTITRIGFCPICAKEHRPYSDAIFLAFGTSHPEYKVLTAGDCSHRQYGYVPHIYKLKKVIGNGDVVIQKSCAMYECGVECDHTNGVNFFYVKNWTQEVWNLETWNALVLLKHNYFTKNYEL